MRESPVASAIIDPLSGAEAFVIRAPVKQTGVAVQRVEQVRAGPDHSKRNTWMQDDTTTNTLYELDSFYINRWSNIVL